MDHRSTYGESHRLGSAECLSASNDRHPCVLSYLRLAPSRSGTSSTGAGVVGSCRVGATTTVDTLGPRRARRGATVGVARRTAGGSSPPRGGSGRRRTQSSTPLFSVASPVIVHVRVLLLLLRSVGVAASLTGTREARHEVTLECTCYPTSTVVLG